MSDKLAPAISVSLIVARADNYVIGSHGKLPWHLPEDLKFFQRTTLGKPIIMGRKTYDSIGKPLARRTNIVLTRNPSWIADDVLVAHSAAEALALAYEEAHRTGVDEVVVIGGAEVFGATIAHANRIYLTEVHQRYEGEVTFEFAPSLWEQANCVRIEGEPTLDFRRLERKASA